MSHMCADAEFCGASHVQDHKMGIIILRDTNPEQEEDLLTPAPFDQPDFFSDEPSPPEPFEWP